MRYRFRGLIRETGRSVEGHVEADVEQSAYNALSDHGIVTESLIPDPPADPLPPGLLAQRTPFSDAIDSALDTSSHQIPFDTLTERYRGKQVWVIDRDKIRSRVAQVVDAAMSKATQGHESADEMRKSVAEAIDGLFRDNRNLTSKVSSNANIDEQVDRLHRVVQQAESVLAMLSAAARNLAAGGWAGGGVPRRYATASSGGRNQEQNAVLLEIFRSNLELQRSVDEVKGPAEALVEAAPPNGAAPAVDTGTPPAPPPAAQPN